MKLKDIQPIIHLLQNAKTNMGDKIKKKKHLCFVVCIEYIFMELQNLIMYVNFIAGRYKTEVKPKVVKYLIRKKFNKNVHFVWNLLISALFVLKGKQNSTHNRSA